MFKIFCIAITFLFSPLFFVTSRAQLGLDVALLSESQHRQFPTSLSLGSDCNPAIASGDINGDGYTDLVMGQPEKDMIKVILGDSEGLFSSGQSMNIEIKGNANSKLGCSLSFLKDFNGDIFEDLAIGAPGERAVYVLFGRPDIATLRVLDDSLSAGDGIKLFISEINPTTPSSLGHSVASARDVDRDGLVDVIIGDHVHNTAYLVFGSAVNTGALPLDQQDKHPTRVLKFASPSGDFALGWAVSSAGDLNQDGYSDVAVSSFVGASVYVVFGAHKDELINFWRGVSLETLRVPSVRGFSFEHEYKTHYFGWTLAVVGDVNDDGFDDLAVGAWRRGAVYILFGRSSDDMIKEPMLIKRSLTDEDWKHSLGVIIGNPNQSSAFGFAITPGDCNMDSIQDLLIGSHGEQSMYCVYGNTSFLSQDVGPITPKIFSSVPNSAFGGSLSTSSVQRGDVIKVFLIGDSLLGVVHVVKNPFIKQCKKMIRFKKEEICFPLISFFLISILTLKSTEV